MLTKKTRMFARGGVLGNPTKMRKTTVPFAPAVTRKTRTIDRGGEERIDERIYSH